MRLLLTGSPFLQASANTLSLHALKRRLPLSIGAMLFLQVMHGQPTPAMAAEGGRIDVLLGYADVGDRRYFPLPEAPPEHETACRPPPMRVLTPAENENYGHWLRSQDPRNYPTTTYHVNPHAWDRWLEGLQESGNVDDQRGPQASDD
jgi:hypothetical protein